MTWRERVIDHLINAGTVGAQQTELLTMLRRQANARDMLRFLNVLKAENKVQVFRVPSARGLTANVWRATTKILEP